QQMKLLLLLVVLGTVSAEVQDLSGKMFTFPQPTNTAHVRLNPTKQGYTIYMFVSSNRSVTDLKRDHALFSLSTPTYDNEIQSYVGTGSVAYGGWDYKPNTWHSICTTWDSVTGLVQIWFDGKPSIRKFVHSGAITQTVIVLLGQDQDSHGGRFDINQSFVGMMSDVHMWDYILSPCEIQNYMNKGSFLPGNVLNWKALDFQIIGNVLIENQADCQPQCMFIG
uniref:Pentraxin family member n=1 Tax=Oryzias latipes TaxID=8090 RepID=A0A3P9KUY8_ORYLA